MYRLSQFRYEKSFNTLYGDSSLFGGRFPTKVEIVSEMTGRIVTFLPVQYGHRFYDEDHWDGEMQVYVPSEELNTLERLVIHHAY